MTILNMMPVTVDRDQTALAASFECDGQTAHAKLRSALSVVASTHRTEAAFRMVPGICCATAWPAPTV